MPSSENSRDKKETVGFVIELPQDEERVAKLGRKLKEYEGRETTAIQNGEKQPAHEMYKRVILGELLREGRVDLNDLMKRMSEVHGGINREEFIDAANVIQTYTEFDKAIGEQV